MSVLNRTFDTLHFALGFADPLQIATEVKKVAALPCKYDSCCLAFFSLPGFPIISFSHSAT